MPDPETLRREVADLDWYHTIELAPGIVTRGWFDLRPIVDDVPIPASLAGKRCMDVGTFDGFWAFELERRGAQEVVAIDILEPAEWDWPADTDPATVAEIGRRKAGGRGFEIARRELGSSVERLELSVYDLDREDVGAFDLVFLGSLLLHLRDPVGALERVRSVCDGQLVLVDAVDLLRSVAGRRPLASLDGRGRPWWWKPNMAGLARMVEAAGFAITDGPRRVYLPPGAAYPVPPLRPRLLLTAPGREAATVALKGDPHATLAAVPR
jgi:tRNA (mo5U34)-methyltransferase